jgi:hypothetical protein
MRIRAESNDVWGNAVTSHAQVSFATCTSAANLEDAKQVRTSEGLLCSKRHG